MNIITGYKGTPHITAQEDRDINAGIVGNSLTDVYVLNVGQQLEADIVTANEIRIRDGILVMQGCAASIDYGAYDALEISNGTQGMQRIDIIAAQYEKDGDTNIESIELVVVEGEPDAGDPQPPTLIGGDIQGGDTFVQMPLYYVYIDGVSIDRIEKEYTDITNLENMQSSYINSMYFMPGDTYICNGRFGGDITSASQQIQFSAVLPKNAKYCAGFRITDVKGGIRITTGGYADNVTDGTSWAGRSGISFSGGLYNDDGTGHVANDGKDSHQITFNISKTSTFKQNGTTTSVVNNTPVVLAGSAIIVFE